MAEVHSRILVAHLARLGQHHASAHERARRLANRPLETPAADRPAAPSPIDKGSTSAS